jgi:uncharacterized membrane protein
MVIHLCHESIVCPSKNGAPRREAVMILRIFTGAVIGAALGFGWHKLVGCSTGACPLTANPYVSTLYGTVVGALVAGSFR